MTWSPNISTERREAIRRAVRAVVRLAIEPEATLPARRQNGIVNDTSVYTDREAWDAVAALEHMVVTRGLVTAQQIEAERKADAVAVLMGGGGGPVTSAGDEYLAHSQQHPELYDDDGDPIDYPCAECGAEAGEECRPYCIGTPGAQRLDDEG